MLRSVATASKRRSEKKEAPLERVRRRTWPILLTIAFVSLGTAYCFRWGSVVQGHPSSWVAPDDLWATFGAAVSFSHGHFGAIYQSQTGFLAFPGILLLLTPVAALSGALQTTLVKIGTHHELLRHPQIFLVQGSPNLHTEVLTSGGSQYLAHPQVLLLLEPYTLLLSCAVLFACDALAERLGVAWNRRALLGLAEAVILWNVAVFWGHPEDAVAVALALYAGLWAMNGRWSGAGWLFGAALALQPLVIVIFPILLVLGGRGRAAGLIVRGVLPLAVITVPSLAANFHTTFHTLTDQPAFPRRTSNHRTPWTALAPKLGGRGPNTSIGGGPVRLVALALAVVVGWWSRRWKNSPELLVWAMAIALALRCATEAVMTSYYVWPTLAVGLVVAARADRRRFTGAVVLAIVTTVVAQWHLGEWLWWVLDLLGIAGVLVLSCPPALAHVDAPARSEPMRWRSPSPPPPTGVTDVPAEKPGARSNEKPKAQNNKAVARRGKNAGRRR